VGRPIPRLAGQTVGIVGLGRIGAAVARKLRGFGLTLLGADPCAPTPEGVARVPLDELLERSDIVTLHCPLDASTRHLIDATALARMKPTALLVNTARGGVVDTAALARALAEGRLAGAGLDVLETEPMPPGHPLAALDTVVLTPHAAWHSDGAMRELKRKTAQAVRDVLEGRRPASVVNPGVLDRG
ncbi:MAG TPA: NAD(P)-dependent oxidoreductase, partial [Methylomirabilota bacterium]|nr:NAD(P)-dependent oxidoreductase [Methylomirabilota bacterium]